jgi:Cu+-exporting ATPase
MVGTGRGARKGILIRDIDALQKAEKIDTVVLDKTGTLTLGKPTVSDVIALNGMSRDEVLRLAAAAEQFSEHPVARAINIAARELRLRIPNPESFVNEPGLGVVAHVEGRKLLVGSASLLERYGALPASDEENGELFPGGTRVYVAAQQPDGQVERLGLLSISDEVKPDSKRAIDELHRLGLRTVLLTGDNRFSAEAIARQVGIDEIHADVKPDQKAAVIRHLQSSPDQPSHCVAMVGDGINDAPALAQADLGIALGSGSDIAKETGDIVLVSGSLTAIPTAIRLSRATMRKIRQNLFFAFIYNSIGVPIAAGILYPFFGLLLSPIFAAAAMSLSSVSVIANSLRLGKVKL